MLPAAAAGPSRSCCQACHRCRSPALPPPSMSGRAPSREAAPGAPCYPPATCQGFVASTSNPKPCPCPPSCSTEPSVARTYLCKWCGDIGRGEGSALSGQGSGAQVPCWLRRGLQPAGWPALPGRPWGAALAGSRRALQTCAATLSHAAAVTHTSLEPCARRLLLSAARGPPPCNSCPAPGPPACACSGPRRGAGCAPDCGLGVLQVRRCSSSVCTALCVPL